MKAVLLALALETASGLALAQGGADPVMQLRACSVLEHAQRVECLENLSRRIAPAESPAAPPAARTAEAWIVSETTSPVNYAPIVTATASSQGSDGASMQLAIRCRSGRTELVALGASLPGGGADVSISYRINGGQPVQLGGAAPSAGGGVAFPGDAVRLLQSLPEDGQIAVRLAARSGAVQEGQFPLGGLNAVREKLSTACRWPNAVAGPRNERSSTGQRGAER